MALTRRSKKILSWALRDMKNTYENIDNCLTDISATKASFDDTVNEEGGGTFTLTVEADSAGAAGNDSITGNGTDDCSTLIGALTESYTISSGGANILANGETVEISGGQDLQTSGGSLSEVAKIHLRNGLCDKRAYDELISAIENGSGSSSLSYRTKKIMKWMFCDNRAYRDFLNNM